MKKNIFYWVCILGAFCILLMGCKSTSPIPIHRPFTEIYNGEAEQLLSGTIWQLYDLKSNDTFSIFVEFQADGKLFWYNNSEGYNEIISENSTCERNDDDLIFNASNGYYLYEGKLNESIGELMITGRYKTGYIGRGSHPSGDFIMRIRYLYDE